MKLKFGGSYQNFPDFLVVGAAKSGTSSLHNYLAAHPDIVLPERKETWFWHQNRNKNQAIFNYCDEGRLPASLKEYLALFSEAGPNSIVGEVCPSYLYYHRQTIESLQEFHPEWRDVKIIIILRNPTDRICSEYRFVRQNDLDPDCLSLAQALKFEAIRKYDDQLLLDLHYRSLSLYSSQVDAYLKAFPDVFVCLFDELRSDTKGLLNNICDFLGVSQDAQIDVNKRYNASNPVLTQKYDVSGFLFNLAKYAGCIFPEGARKRGAKISKRLLYREEIIPEELVRSLRKEFIPEIEKLEQLIDPNLSAWKSID